MKAIDTVLILEADGTEVYYPKLDYESNPRLGTIVVSHRSRPEPIVDPVVREVQGTKARRPYGGFQSNPGNFTFKMY
jgi:hypothetical protein